MSARHKTHLRPSGRDRFLLRDDFLDVRTVGAVNGTPAVPGPGLRTEAGEPGSALDGAYQWGVYTTSRPTLCYAGTPVALSPGRVMCVRLRLTGGAQFAVGWDSSPEVVDVPGTLSTGGVQLRVQGPNASLRFLVNNQHNTNLFTRYPNNTEGQRFAIVTGAARAYLFRRLNGDEHWLLEIDRPGAIAASACAYWTNFTDPANSSAGALHTLRVPAQAWLPVPLASDSFTRPDGPLGSSEGRGPDGQGAPVRPWAGPGWAVCSGRAAGTPQPGAELLTNGGMETNAGWGQSLLTPTVNAQSTEQAHGGAFSWKLATDAENEGGFCESTGDVASGTWLLYTGWVYLASGTAVSLADMAGSRTPTGVTLSPPLNSWTWARFAARQSSDGPQATQPGIRLASAGSVCYFDDFSVRSLAPASLFASLADTGTPAVLASAALTLAPNAACPAGLVTNLDAAASPRSFLLAYHDGVNAALLKCVNGVYTSLVALAAAYSPGAVLRLHTLRSGAGLKARLYYNETMIGAEQAINDAAIVNNIRHGLFSTCEDNRLDDYRLFAHGEEGQYDAFLNRVSAE